MTAIPWIRHGDPPARLSGRRAQRQDLPSRIQQRGSDSSFFQHGGRPIERKPLADSAQIDPRSSWKEHRALPDFQAYSLPFPSGSRVGTGRSAASECPRERLQRRIERTLRDAGPAQRCLQYVEERATHRDRSSSCARVEQRKLAVLSPIAEKRFEMLHLVQRRFQRFPYLPGVLSRGLESKDRPHEITGSDHGGGAQGMPARRGGSSESDQERAARRSTSGTVERETSCPPGCARPRTVAEVSHRLKLRLSLN